MKRCEAGLVCEWDWDCDKEECDQTEVHECPECKQFFPAIVFHNNMECIKCHIKLMEEYYGAVKE